MKLQGLILNVNGIAFPPMAKYLGDVYWDRYAFCDKARPWSPELLEEKCMVAGLFNLWRHGHF